MVFRLGIITPEIIYDAAFQQQLQHYYGQWRTEWEKQQPVFKVANVRFAHDPDWKNRFFSIQSAHDGGHWIWKATKIVFGPFAGGVI